jgi:hypothetical protein
MNTNLRVTRLCCRFLCLTVDCVLMQPWSFAELVLYAGEPSDLHEHTEAGTRASHESIAGFEAMLSPGQELPQIDNDALEVILRTGMLYADNILKKIKSSLLFFCLFFCVKPNAFLCCKS